MKHSRKNIIFETSDPYCCVACLLQIIILSETGINFGQSKIADSFGVYVPQSYKGSIKNIHFTEDQNKYGIILTSNSINNFFKKNKILLKEIYFPVSLYEDWTFEEKIKEELDKLSYIIVGYDYGILNKQPESYKIGHVSMILDYDPSAHTVTLFDPGPNLPGIKTINAYDLYKAVKGKKDGLWCISSI